MPKRILLAWESGSGRGHIVRLKTIAQALGEAFIYDASLGQMNHANEIAPLCDLAFKGSFLMREYDARGGTNGVVTAT